MKLNIEKIAEAIDAATDYKIQGRRPKFAAKCHAYRGDKDRIPSLFVDLDIEYISNYEIALIAKAILKHEDDHIMLFVHNENLRLLVSFRDIRPEFFSEDLEKAAERYSEGILAGGEDMFDAIADGFIAGANWQKEQAQQ